MRGNVANAPRPLMNADLEKLIRLHHAETEARRLEAELAQVPRARQELDARLAGERQRLDAAKADLDATTKARRAHEAVVQDLETKRSKYKGQLMDVKTNKEYTAMLHEIEGVERDIRAREDQILEEMERMEALALEVKREEAAFKAVEDEAKVERRTLETGGSFSGSQRRWLRRSGWLEPSPAVIATHQSLSLSSGY